MRLHDSISLPNERHGQTVIEIKFIENFMADVNDGDFCPKPTDK